MDTLKECMQDVHVTSLAGMDFYEGLLEGIPAVVVRSGVGKVNAAMCTQILADRFGVDAVINTGVAGSLDARIDIGDFVYSTDVVHHDVDAATFGYKIGEVPQLGVFSFPADEELAALAGEAAAEISPDRKVWRGRVASGDQFIVSREKKRWIAQQFDASCTEMEGAAIAQAAFLNGIPFLIIRAISDKADESAVVDYPTFEDRAARSSAAILRRMAASMAAAVQTK